MPEQKRRAVPTATSFWDTSAIVPLCCYQSVSSTARRLARTYGRQVVWWAASVEAIGAFQRLVREGHIAQQANTQAKARLAYLRSRWNEVQPSEHLRNQGERLLCVHKLRAADALQLAAALLWCNNNPRNRVFIANDSALLTAAQIEGFTIFHL
jgi:predicted nucleic acid-binding protein